MITINAVYSDYKNYKYISFGTIRRDSWAVYEMFF